MGVLSLIYLVISTFLDLKNPFHLSSSHTNNRRSLDDLSGEITQLEGKFRRRTKIDVREDELQLLFCKG